LQLQSDTHAFEPVAHFVDSLHTVRRVLVQEGLVVALARVQLRHVAGLDGARLHRVQHLLAVEVHIGQSRIQTFLWSVEVAAGKQRHSSLLEHDSAELGARISAQLLINHVAILTEVHKGVEATISVVTTDIMLVEFLHCPVRNCLQNSSLVSLVLIKIWVIQLVGFDGGVRDGRGDGGKSFRADLHHGFLDVFERIWNNAETNTPAASAMHFRNRRKNNCLVRQIAANCCLLLAVEHKL